jgi:hypothetical protein
MCTASGRWLGDHDVGKALAAWKKLPESERLPGAVRIEDRGTFNADKGVEPPPSALIVRAFTRDLGLDANKQLAISREDRFFFTNGVRYEILRGPNRDFLWLTRAEWQALVPNRPKKGHVFPVPDSVRNRILRFHLVDNAQGLSGSWKLSEIRSAQMTLTVDNVGAAGVTLRLDGHAFLSQTANPSKTDQTYNGSLLGFVKYDPRKKAIRSFDVVAVGAYVGTRHQNTERHRVSTILGTAFELAQGTSSADRVPPRGTRLVNGSSESLLDYFRDAPGVVRAQ